MHRARILVTQGELKQTLAIVRELGRFGHVVDVLSMGRISIHGLAVAAFSKYCNKHYKVSNYKDEHIFINEVIDILKGGNYDFILPVGAPFVEWITRNKKSIGDLAAIPFPSEEKIRNFESKKFTNEFASSLGIPVPSTIYPIKIEEVDLISKWVDYPVVIKANKEVGGNILDYAADGKELIEKYRAIVSKYDLQDDLPGVQEFLTGKGAGFFALYDNGKYIQGFQHLRIREYPLSGGASTCAKSVFDEKIKEYGKRILDAYCWDGLAMVEFKYNSKGVPHFLEVNPKFWGSYDLSSVCNVNFANKLILTKMGTVFPNDEPYDKNVNFSWPFNGDIQHCYEIGTLTALFWDVFSGRVKTNFTLSDTMGSLALLINWFYLNMFKFYARVKNQFEK